MVYMEVNMKIIIITGVSGAGKSLAVKALEDMGYFCVDNLPPALIPKFADICCHAHNRVEKVALVMDIRGGEFFNDFFYGVTALKEAGLSYEILFLEASDEVLIKRYKESRRSHPLSPQGRIIKGIKEERAKLQEVKKIASHILDTSNLSPRKFKESLVSIFAEGKKFEGLIINIISFGFKYGIPLECDLVFDVRFIPNPFYVPALKKLSGKNDAVREYVFNCEETHIFLQKLIDMLSFLIPNYIKEGKTQLIIGIGCTGGKHRSVAIAESLAGQLEEKGHKAIVDHRDIEKDNRSVH